MSGKCFHSARNPLSKIHQHNSYMGKVGMLTVKKRRDHRLWDSERKGEIQYPLCVVSGAGDECIAEVDTGGGAALLPTPLLYPTPTPHDHLTRLH